MIKKQKLKWFIINGEKINVTKNIGINKKGSKTIFYTFKAGKYSVEDVRAESLNNAREKSILLKKIRTGIYDGHYRERIGRASWI